MSDIVHLKIKGNLIMLYWYKWQFRNILKEKYGKIARQTDDLMGVVLPNGIYISYDEKYHRAYFSGIIL